MAAAEMAAASVGSARASRDVALQIGARVINLALGIFVTALVARALGDAGFGQWSTLLVVVQLSAYFTSFGVESVVVRQAAAEPDREEEWTGVLLVLRLLLAIPAVFVGLIVVLAVQESAAMLAAGLLLLLQIPFNIGASLRVVHQMRVRNVIPMLVLTFNSAVWGIAVLVIYLTGGGLVALAATFTASAALTALLQTVLALRLVRPDLRPAREAVVEVARIGIPVGISGLLVMAYARVDQLIVFSVAGSSEAGLYGAVYRAVEQAQFVPVSVMTTLMPILTIAWARDRERMVRIARLAAEYLSIASLGALAASIVLAKQVIVLLYGSDFEAAAPALPVLSAAFVFICFGYLTTNLLLIVGMQRRLIRIGLLGLAVNVVGNLLLVPAVGFIGAAWMTLGTEVVVVGAGAVMLAGRLGLSVTGAGLGRLPQIVAAAVGLGLGLAALDAAGLPFAALLVFAAAGYPVLLLGLRALDLAEVRNLLRERSAGG